MNMKTNEIEVNKTYILVGFERNRAVKVMEKSQNEIWVRMPEGDLMPVDAEDLRETKATAPEPTVGREQDPSKNPIERGDDMKDQQRDSKDHQSERRESRDSGDRENHRENGE